MKFQYARAIHELIAAILHDDDAAVISIALGSIIRLADDHYRLSLEEKQQLLVMASQRGGDNANVATKTHSPTLGLRPGRVI